MTIIGAIFASLSVYDEKDVDAKYQSIGSLSGLDASQIAAVAGAASIVILIFVVIGIFLSVMATSLEVKSTAGKKPTLGELFNDGKKYFFRFIGLCILLGIIIVFGLLLLIVPGIFALGRLAMAPYHMIDKDLGIIEAIKASNEQAKGRMTKVYAAIGVTILIGLGASMVEGLLPVIGPLLAAVISIGFSLVLALRYQQLKHA